MGFDMKKYIININPALAKHIDLKEPTDDNKFLDSAKDAPIGEVTIDKEIERISSLMYFTSTTDVILLVFFFFKLYWGIKLNYSIVFPGNIATKFLLEENKNIGEHKFWVS